MLAWLVLAVPLQQQQGLVPCNFSAHSSLQHVIMHAIWQLMAVEPVFWHLILYSRMLAHQMLHHLAKLCWIL
jgi:hypothetical protein